MPVILKTPSAVMPVTVALVKKHTVIGAEIGTVDDELLSLYISAATLYGQHITGRSFVEATFELDLEEFPTGKVKLMPNLQAVDSVVYTDADGAQITLDTAEYKIRRTHLVGYIEPVDSWPDDAEEIFVTFKAGYPVDQGAVTTPSDIIGWLMVRVADMYAQRESFVLNGTVSEMPASHIDHVLNNHVVPGYGAGV